VPPALGTTGTPSPSKQIESCPIARPLRTPAADGCFTSWTQDLHGGRLVICLSVVLDHPVSELTDTRILRFACGRFGEADFGHASYKKSR
jgi:hypothetical protein